MRPSNGPPGGGVGEIDPRALARVLWRQRKLVIGFFAAVVSAAVVVTALTPKTYRAVSVVQLMPRAGQEVEVKEVVRNDDGGYMESRDRARTHLQLMTSRGVRQQVVEAYNKLGYDDYTPSAESLDALGRAMSAAPREDTQLVEIAVQHADPERAAILANLYADLYCASNLAARTDAARETQGWLGSQAQTARDTLDAANQGLLAFTEEHDLVGADEKLDGITSQLSSLQNALGELTARRALVEGNVKEHRRLLAQKEFEVLAGMYTDPALDAMLKDRARVLTETAEVLARYGDQHPEHQQAAARIARVEQLIAEEVGRNVQAEESEVQSLRRQEAQVGEELDRVKAELMAKQKLLTDYQTLKGEAERARWLDDALKQRSAEVELQANSRLNDVRVVDRAVPPSRPSSPNVVLNLAVALALGLGGGVALAIARHRLDDTMWDADDVEPALRIPLLGVLPSLDKATVPERALYAHEHPRSTAAEAVRWARSLLLANRSSDGRQCLLVTSCEAEEGKTHVAVQLAASYAHSGFKTLLIDADLRCPQVHECFAFSPEPGLADACTSNASSDSFLVGTVVDNLDVLPCGVRVESADEIFAGARLQMLLAALRVQYDVVIIDSPPASVLADALTLSRHADGVVLVVRRGRVKRSVIRTTLDRLGRVHARIAGVVFNDVPADERASKYYDDRRSTEPAPLT